MESIFMESIEPGASRDADPVTLGLVGKVLTSAEAVLGKMTVSRPVGGTLKPAKRPQSDKQAQCPEPVSTQGLRPYYDCGRLPTTGAVLQRPASILRQSPDTQMSAQQTRRVPVAVAVGR